ncbi:uncharacterized protein LOC129592610 [Paramacrobiotus metropolitanus]|uniref:uncharacterized protein LOC129592610 n=1 Tax=Paramacrobiotus metropolitanus TaxID=2943436 RepID=UPI002445E704|nr:uncharacterized protein LOC129592610 [Paramacrobiotus metropolitanus]
MSSAQRRSRQRRDREAHARRRSTASTEHQQSVNRRERERRAQRRAANPGVRAEERQRDATAHARTRRISNLLNPQIIATTLEQKMQQFKWSTCKKCNEAWPGLKLDSKQLCANCRKPNPKFAKSNNMDPGEIPPALKCLSFIEQQLIAKVHPVVSVYKIGKGQQLGYTGNVINFLQDVKGFAKKLPHHPSDLMSVVVTSRHDADNYTAFRVSASRVRRALLWLKKHNMWYKDIQIDERALNSLPQDGNLHSLLATMNAIPAEFSDEVERVSDTGVPNIMQINQAAQIREAIGADDVRVPYPAMNEVPIDEFNTAGYIAQAFPCLFPTGNADLRDNRGRANPVTETEYFKHLMRLADGRFAKHPTFRFFALNSVLRWQALQTGQIFVRKSSLGNVTSEQLREMLNHNPQLIKQIMNYGAKLRGTRSYWFQRSAELADMVRSIGVPTIFFTLSAADLYWPEIFDLIDPTTTSENCTEKEILRRRTKALQENPLIADWYFVERSQQFIHKILTPRWKIKDYWYRYECALLAKMDKRCRQAKPENSDEPFGGMFVYLFGDINQLPPVLDRPLYGDGFAGELADYGQMIYRTAFTKSFILQTSHRQSGTDTEQQHLRDALDRISTGDSTQDDYDKIMTRVHSLLPAEDQIGFRGALHLFSERDPARSFNEKALTNLNMPVARIRADHNGNMASKGTEEQAMGLESTLYLSRGSRVMLKRNLWTAKGLVNGALGYVRDIVYEPGTSPTDSLPFVILVEFDKYTGPTFANNCVPIAPITTKWTEKSQNCSRTQFPLTLAWAITIHKGQGITCDKAVIHIGRREFASGLIYVGFSRVKSWNGLAVEPVFPFQLLQSIKQKKATHQRKRELERLQRMS